MVNVKMYKQIQNLKRKGFSKTEIARKLTLNSRTTVKYLKMDEESFRFYRLQHR